MSDGPRSWAAMTAFWWARQQRMAAQAAKAGGQVSSAAYPMEVMMSRSAAKAMDNRRLPSGPVISPRA